MRYRPPLLRTILATLGALLLLLSAAQAADNRETRTREQLQKLKSNMAELSATLQTDLQQRDTLQTGLRDAELAIGAIRAQMRLSQASLQRSQAELVKLRAQRQELLVARGQQQEVMTREIQTAYRMGKQGQLKILLNQERPDTLARAMAYYDYFYRARRSHIEGYLEIISRLDALEPQISSAANELETTRTLLAEQESQLLAGKQQRQLELSRVNAGIRSKDEQLQKMTRDSDELQRLLEVIEQAIAALEMPQLKQDFATLKGAMPWPVVGKPSNRYGRKRDNSKLLWQGLIIPAEEGSTVDAIHGGTVVFADWFRGSGLLLIIDHGDGYMSLYAHNQALLRDVGEPVSAGAAVATVGNSGGRQQAALYFEIRHNGKPVNPGAWLSRG